MPEEKQQELTNDVNHISTNFHPFVITTKNFAAFKPRTIFIDVPLTDELKSLKSAVDTFFSHQYALKTDSRPFHPHITIATRDLHKISFYDAWPLFENKIFNEKWMAKDLSILKHNKKNWDVIHTSEFQ
jgi:2'-5' RNA ligase